MVKAIIFDCFGVLYVPMGDDFYRSHVPEYEKHRHTLHELGFRADHGDISQDEFVVAVAQLMQLPIEDVRTRLVSGLARNQALLTFSQTLRAKYKIGLLSNISAGTMDLFFTQKERANFFDAVVISSEVGLVKPDPAIFMLAAGRLGVLPGECIMVDDSTSNCNGAMQAGMQAVVYQTTEQTKREVQSLL